MDQRRARSPIATSSRGGRGLHARERALAMGDLRHSVCGSRPLNRDGRTDCPYVDEIRTARFLGDPLPVAHSVVLTLSSTQQTWGLMDAAAIGRPRCFVTEPLPDESPLWQLPTCYSARTPPGAPNGWMN